MTFDSKEAIITWSTNAAEAVFIAKLFVGRGKRDGLFDVRAVDGVNAGSDGGGVVVLVDLSAVIRPVPGQNFEV